MLRLEPTRQETKEVKDCWDISSDVSQSGTFLPVEGSSPYEEENKNILNMDVRVYIIQMEIVRFHGKKKQIS